MRRTREKERYIDMEGHNTESRGEAATTSGRAQNFVTSSGNKKASVQETLPQKRMKVLQEEIKQEINGDEPMAMIRVSDYTHLMNVYKLNIVGWSVAVALLAFMLKGPAMEWLKGIFSKLWGKAKEVTVDV